MTEPVTTAIAAWLFAHKTAVVTTGIAAGTATVAVAYVLEKFEIIDVSIDDEDVLFFSRSSNGPQSTRLNFGSVLSLDNEKLTSLICKKLDAKHGGRHTTNEKRAYEAAVQAKALLGRHILEMATKNKNLPTRGNPPRIGYNG